jgi:hypothetical protein
MGYYVTAAPDYDYYEGDQRASTDISVTQRPHPVATWNGAAWEYVLGECQAYQKRKVSADMTANIEEALSFYAIDIYTLMFVSALVIEATAFEDDTGRAAGSVPMLNAYKTESSSATLQIAADAVQTNWTTIAENIGTALARRDGLFAQIDAETDGFTCFSYEWTSI